MDSDSEKDWSGTSEFEYIPLDIASTIWILCLDTGIRSESLRGNIHHVEVSAARSAFIALSYVWGGPKYE